jgi:ribonuclease HI
MRSALADFPHAIHSVVSSSCFSSIISERFSGSTLTFTDGSRSEEGTGFEVYVPTQYSFGYRLQEPSGVFTTEITALLTALRFVGSGQPGEFLILTDSLSSIEALRSRKISPMTHSVVYECKKALWRLRANQFVVRLMWVPAHVGIDGNEMVDRIAKESAASGNLYRGGALECDLCPQMKSCLLMDWQSRWDGGDMGRYAFSIFPRVRLSPRILDVVAKVI